MLYFLIGFVCSFVGVCIGWHFGEKSGIKYGFERGKVSERCSLISVTFPVKCPACNKEYGLEVSPPKHKGLM